MLCTHFAQQCTGGSLLMAVSYLYPRKDISGTSLAIKLHSLEFCSHLCLSFLLTGKANKSCELNLGKSTALSKINIRHPTQLLGQSKCLDLEWQDRQVLHPCFLGQMLALLLPGWVTYGKVLTQPVRCSRTCKQAIAIASVFINLY